MEMFSFPGIDATIMTRSTTTDRLLAEIAATLGVDRAMFRVSRALGHWHRETVELVELWISLDCPHARQRVLDRLKILANHPLAIGERNRLSFQ